jgi:hypothetical protein
MIGVGYLETRGSTIRKWIFGPSHQDVRSPGGWQAKTGDFPRRRGAGQGLSAHHRSLRSPSGPDQGPVALKQLQDQTTCPRIGPATDSSSSIGISGCSRLG